MGTEPADDCQPVPLSRPVFPSPVINGPYDPERVSSFRNTVESVSLGRASLPTREPTIVVRLFLIAKFAVNLTTIYGFDDRSRSNLTVRGFAVAVNQEPLDNEEPWNNEELQLNIYIRVTKRHWTIIENRPVRLEGQSNMFEETTVQTDGLTAGTKARVE
ncbi:uncharacterized protein LOC143147184 isoform X1 [Ptiloglossa arizonensis]|uniref:uncharacterized protein LOC143147184 isoform X1 n=1 Tax=Ptiloglossa arizonensis TaxID=3350558 RepID=UPI003FA043E9